MGFNFHVPLPGPFSYSARVGGKKGPSTAEQIEQLQAERAVRDLKCPRHLAVHDKAGWFILIVFWSLAALIFGPWAIPLAAVFATITWGLHKARHQRREPHLELLASGNGCEECHKEAKKVARRAELNPLAQLGEKPPHVPQRRGKHQQ